MPILLNSHPGTKYGIHFPVIARAAYGLFGANVPAVMRRARGVRVVRNPVLDGRGHALQRFVESLWPGWPTALGAEPLGGYLPTEWVSYAAFWAVNLLIVYRGMDLLRRIEILAAPYASSR